MTNDTNTIPTRRKERKELLRRYPGLLCAVARLLVGHNRRNYRSKAGHVSQVFHGKATSAPVKEAILRELSRRMAAEKRGSKAEKHVPVSIKTMGKEAVRRAEYDHNVHRQAKAAARVA